MPQQLSVTHEKILKQTSRAFYLSLAILPAHSRRSLSLAYLLARAADTVADSDAYDVDRKATLSSLKRWIASPGDESRLVDLTTYQPSHQGEWRLLQHVPDLISELASTAAPQRESIQAVLQVLIEGMLWDQELFQSGSEGGLSDQDLDRYTYLVAGCVGPFWSDICAGDDRNLGHLREPDSLTTAIEFGKALQWVNILRDIPRDQAEGRFYLPQLLAANFTERFVTGSRRALGAFEKAIDYPHYFPATYLRDRLAVLLPLVLGLRTLEQLFRSGGPRNGVRVKVSRLEVLGWLGAGPFLVLSNRLLKFVLISLHGRAQSALLTLECSVV
jgi:farnesyl-diphosphate farnesyltransferase